MEKHTDSSRVEARRRRNARYWAANKDRINQKRRDRRALLGTLYAQYLTDQAMQGGGADV